MLFIELNATFKLRLKILVGATVNAHLNFIEIHRVFDLIDIVHATRHHASCLTQAHDMELHNVVLYWHFMAITAMITFDVVGLFPEAM